MRIEVERHLQRRETESDEDGCKQADPANLKYMTQQIIFEMLQVKNILLNK